MNETPEPRFVGFGVGELQLIVAALLSFENEWVGFRRRLLDEAGIALDRAIGAEVAAEADATSEGVPPA